MRHFSVILLTKYAFNQSVIKHLKDISKINYQLFLCMSRRQSLIVIYLAFKLSDDVMSTSIDSY